MKKENLYFILGILLLVLGSISFYVVFIYWLFLILMFSGIGLIAKSDKKILIKIITVILVPIISIFIFILSIVAFSIDTL